MICINRHKISWLRIHNGLLKQKLSKKTWIIHIPIQDIFSSERNAEGKWNACCAYVIVKIKKKFNALYLNIAHFRKILIKLQVLNCPLRKISQSNLGSSAHSHMKCHENFYNSWWSIFFSSKIIVSFTSTYSNTADL